MYMLLIRRLTSIRQNGRAPWFLGIIVHLLGQSDVRRFCQTITLLCGTYSSYVFDSSVMLLRPLTALVNFMIRYASFCRRALSIGFPEGFMTGNTVHLNSFSPCDFWGKWSTIGVCFFSLDLCWVMLVLSCWLVFLAGTYNGIHCIFCFTIGEIGMFPFCAIMYKFCTLYKGAARYTVATFFVALNRF